MRKGQRPLATLASAAWPRGCVPLRADGARAKGRSLRSRPLLGRAGVCRCVQMAQGPKAARYARVRCLAARLCPAACRVATPQAAPQGLPPALMAHSARGWPLMHFARPAAATPARVRVYGRACPVVRAVGPCSARRRGARGPARGGWFAKCAPFMPCRHAPPPRGRAPPVCPPHSRVAWPARVPAIPPAVPRPSISAPCSG